MDCQSSGATVRVLDTDVTFEGIYQEEYLPKDYLEEIKKANLLLLPNRDPREKEGLLFPETTRDFFAYVRAQAEAPIVSDIAVSDEEFRQLELHSAAIEVATVLVQWVVLPVVTSLIASFLHDLVKQHRRKPEETTAKVTIIAEQSEAKKSKMILYEGPVSGAKDALDNAAKVIFSEDGPTA